MGGVFYLLCMNNKPYFFRCLKILPFCLNLVLFVGALHVGQPSARIAQLVEHDLAKVGVAGSSPVSRSTEIECAFEDRSSQRRSMFLQAAKRDAYLLEMGRYTSMYNV